MTDPREDVYLLAAMLSEIERILHPLPRGMRGRVRPGGPVFPPALPTPGRGRHSLGGVEPGAAPPSGTGANRFLAGADDAVARQSRAGTPPAPGQARRSTSGSAGAPPRYEPPRPLPQHDAWRFPPPAAGGKATPASDAPQRPSPPASSPDSPRTREAPPAGTLGRPLPGDAPVPTPRDAATPPAPSARPEPHLEQTRSDGVGGARQPSSPRHPAPQASPLTAPRLEPPRHSGEAALPDAAIAPPAAARPPAGAPPRASRKAAQRAPQPALSPIGLPVAPPAPPETGDRMRRGARERASLAPKLADAQAPPETTTGDAPGTRMVPTHTPPLVPPRHPPQEVQREPEPTAATRAPEPGSVSVPRWPASATVRDPADWIAGGLPRREPPADEAGREPETPVLPRLEGPGTAVAAPASAWPDEVEDLLAWSGLEDFGAPGGFDGPALVLHAVGRPWRVSPEDTRRIRRTLHSAFLDRALLRRR